MNGEFWLVRSERDLEERLGFFADHVRQMGFPVCWKAKPYDPKRSLDQNALINSMYGDIAQAKKDESTSQVRRRCKLHFGVPILRGCDEEFRAVYDKVVKPHDYETKLAIMDYLPVTSRMGKAKATEYINTVMSEHPGVPFPCKEVA